VDVHRDETAGIRPDVIASIANLPYDDHSVHRLYAGHCLEHIPIMPTDGRSAFDAAMREVRRVLAIDGVACFVCPDVYRALTWWKEGRADWALVDACLEGPDGGVDPASAWDGCFHAWNCHQDRLVGLVQRTLPAAVAVPMSSAALDEFPVVSRAEWQCAVLVTP
jgi:SAM-dependent methyltransferase